MNKSPLHQSTCTYVNSSAIAQEYDKYFSHLELFDYDSAVLEKWFAQPGRLIDLGCGTGRHTLQFAQRGFDVTAIDLNPHMLAQTQDKLSRQQLPAKLIQADLCQLPIDTCDQNQSLQRNSFDYALCMFSTLGLIYGHENRRLVLENVRKILTPKGQLAIHVHNRGNNWLRHEGRVFLLTNWILSTLGRMESGDKIMRSYRGIKKMYIHVFTEKEIINLLIDAGYEIIELQTLNYRRTGKLKGTWLRSIRANGFLIRAHPASK